MTERTTDGCEIIVQILKTQTSGALLFSARFISDTHNIKQLLQLSETDS